MTLTLAQQGATWSADADRDHRADEWTAYLADPAPIATSDFCAFVSMKWVPSDADKALHARGFDSNVWWLGTLHIFVSDDHGVSDSIRLDYVNTGPLNGAAFSAKVRRIVELLARHGWGRS